LGFYELYLLESFSGRSIFLATVNDDFPYQSADPDLQPVQGQLAPTNVQPETEEQVYQDIKILLRLLVGTAAEGTDEFARRAKVWQAQMNNPDASGMIVPLDQETDAVRLRYALLGLLFKTMDAGYNGLSLAEKATSKVLGTVSFILSPFTKSRLWRPVKNNFDAYSQKGESVVNNWIATGRREEQASRYLARKQAYEDIVDDAIEYLSNKPEVNDLIQNQSIGLAEEMVDNLRERSNAYDDILESRIKTILRRNKPK
jgi:hypothetical protein